MFLPNFRRASSAASSAFSISFSRLAASVRNLEIIPSDSRRASLSVRSLIAASAESASEASLLAEAAAAPLAGTASLVEMDRVRLTMVVLRSVNPLRASPLTAEASCRAPS